MTRPSSFLASKWYFICFVIGYTLVASLLVYDFLVAHQDTPMTALTLFWAGQLTMLTYPNKSHYQLWSFRFSNLVLSFVIASKVYAGLVGVRFIPIALVLVLVSLLPSRWFDRLAVKR